MDENLAMSSAVVWHEMLNLPKYTINETLTIAGWLKEAGYEKASRDLRKLTLIGSSALQASAHWASDYHRLAIVEDQIEKLRRGYGSLKTLKQVVTEGLEAGPGMVVTAAAAGLQRGGKKEAKPYVELNQARYPQHAETWKASQVYGVQIDKAQMSLLGEALAQDYFNENQVVTRATDAANTMKQMGMPQFWNLRLERVELLERDQPEALWTLFLRATVKDSLGEWDAEQEEILRQAIGKAGGPFAEHIDYHLRHLLGVCLLRQGKIDEGMANLRLGGWPGVEELLTWRRAEGGRKGLRKALKWAAKPRFALSPRGSDAVRMEIACELAQSAPKRAYRAFAAMNDTLASKDFPLFSQLISSAERNAEKFVSALEKEKMGFYSPARAIFYLALASEFENPGVSVPKMQLARMLPGQRETLSFVKAGRKESIKANAVSPEIPGLVDVPSIKPFRWEPMGMTLKADWGAAPVSVVDWRYESGELRNLYCRFRVLTKDGIGGELKLHVEERLPDGRWAVIGETPLLANADYPFDVEMPLSAVGPGKTFRARLSFGLNNPYTELAAPESDDSLDDTPAEVQIRRIVISPIEVSQQ